MDVMRAKAEMFVHLIGQSLRDTVGLLLTAPSSHKCIEEFDVDSWVDWFLFAA